MAKYTVVSPVEHNGKRFEVGATLNVAEAVAAALLSAGAIAQAVEVPAQASIAEVNPVASLDGVSVDGASA